MKGSNIAIAVLVSSILGLSGCIYRSHGQYEIVHDADLTFDDYDGTTSYEPAEDAPMAEPPVEVHEFDEAAATAAGASKVFDGQDWLDADDFERNDILNKIENEHPKDVTVVIVVATGDIWVIPDEKFDAVSKIIEPWWDEDYDQLDEYVGEQYRSGQLTIGKYLSIAQVENSNQLGRIYYVHDLGPIGVKEIRSAEGLQVMMHQTWLSATPERRFLKLQSIEHYLGLLPEFQGKDNRPAFGVSIPWGSVYAVPEQKYEKLIGGGAIGMWTDEQVGNLPRIGWGPPRTQRGERPIIIREDIKF